MKYDETLIMRYGEVDIEKIILSILTKEKKEINEVYNESRKSSNRDCILIEKKIALENYILKYYNNPKNAELKKAMNAVVNGVGKGFSTGNIEMLSSLFLKSENASKLYNTKQLTFLSDTMKKLQTKTNQIYSNFLKGKELNDFEKKCLMKFFIYYKGADVKSNVYKAQLNYMNYLFNKDNYDKTLNNIDELEFVSNFTVAHFFRYFYKNIPEPSIIMGSLPNYSRGCSTGATVIIRDIPEVFLNRLETLKTINHECRHVIQSAKLEKEKNISAYDMTKRVLFSKFLSTKDYDNYRQNYRFEPIERDAETTGYFKTRVMLDEIIDDKEVFKKVDFYLRDLEENTKRKRAYPFTFIIDENGKKNFSEDFEFDNLKKIIQSYPEYVSKYPVLEILFNKNGTNKEFEEVLTDQKHLGIFSNEVAFNFCRHWIKEDLLDEIDISKFNRLEQMTMFGKLLDLFYDEAKKIAEAFDCYGKADNLTDMDYYKTMTNHIEILEKLIKYINKHMSLIYYLERHGKVVDVHNTDCNLSTFKRGVEVYANSVKKNGSISLVRNKLKEIEAMMVDNYNNVEEIRNRKINA